MTPREGDHQHYRRLTRLLGNRRRFLGYAFALTRNQDDAEDLLQDSVLKALRAISCLRDEGAFDSWFFRLIKHVFIDMQRRKKATGAPLLCIEDDVGKGREADHLGVISDPERIAVSHLAAEDVWRSLDMLPLENAEIVVLHYVMEYTVPEIVNLTGVMDGTVRSRISRGRSKLRDLLSRTYIL